MIYAIAGVVAGFAPELWLVLSALCNGVVLVNALTVWRPSASIAPADVSASDR